MFYSVRFVFLLLLFSSFLSTGDAQFYLGGIIVEEDGIFSSEQEYNDHFGQMSQIGMNTVEVTHYSRHGVWDSADLDIGYSKDETIAQIKIAKEKGLKVILILRVYLKPTFGENQFLWHGMILPQGNDALQQWFDTYQQYILDWAAIAEAYKVDAMVLGSEMNELASTQKLRKLPSLYSYYANERVHTRSEKRIIKYKNKLQKHHLIGQSTDSFDDVDSFVKSKISAERSWYQQVGVVHSDNQIQLLNIRRKALKNYWRKLIQKTRSIYHGSISYAANFDNYQEIAFWDDLDFISINAYFPLMSSDKSCDDQACVYKECKSSWSKALSDIEDFKKRENLDQSVVFTELGYTRRKGNTTAPWQSRGYSIVGPWYNQRLILWQDQPLQSYERVAAVDALYDAVKERGFPLSGILYWKLSSDKCSLDIEPYTLLLSQPAVDELQGALLRFMN